MDINRRVVGDVAILDLQGGMGWGNDLSALKTEVDDLLGQGRVRILLHLADVPLLDTHGITELVSSYVAARHRDCQVKFICPHKHHRKVFSLTKLDAVLEVLDSEEDALRSFSIQG